MVDFHTHSTYSDGSDTPVELVERARRRGLHAIALTDHDNAGGVSQFLEACRQNGISGLSGVELSIAVTEGSLHIVGLGIDPECPELRGALGNVLDGRAWRNRRILEKLAGLGYGLSWEEVAHHAGEEIVGRPHFALAMIDHGWVTSVQEAFDRFLGHGAPAYVDRYRLTPQDALRLIRLAGGVSIMAHPLTLSDVPARLDAEVEDLKSQGLDGIEAYYPSHSQEATIDLLRLARRHDLLISGGTDYHGLDVRPEADLGTGNGSFCVPDSVLAPIIGALGDRGHFHLEGRV